MLVFGESEVRYLESLPPAERTAVAATRLRPRPAVRADHRRLRAAGRGRSPRPTRATCRCCEHAAATPEAMARLSAVLDSYLGARGAVHGVLMDILGLGVLVGRRERHRQERVRARPGRPRTSAGRRRRGGAAVPRAVVRDRQLPRADAPPHGDPRAGADQRAGPVRRGVDAHLEAGRAGRAAGALGAGPRVRPTRHRRGVLRDCSASASR